MDSKQYSGEAVPEQPMQRALTPGLEKDWLITYDWLMVERQRTDAAIEHLENRITQLSRSWWKKVFDGW